MSGDSRRIAWVVDSEDIPELSSRLVVEKDKYDEWAKRKIERVGNLAALQLAHREQAWWLAPPAFDQASAAVETVEELKCLDGKRVLDIGGSLLDSWRFLWFGNAKGLDQIEVSPVS